MTATNIGRTDTAIRATLGSLLMVLGALAADAHPFLALGAAFVAVVILVTAIAGVCPLYALLGVDGPPSRKRPSPISITAKPAYRLH
jgi:hypothetical protein